DRRDAGYARRIGDELGRTSQPEGGVPDFAGASFTWERTARATSTASRGEGIVAVARLAEKLGDPRAKKFRRAARAAAEFVLAQQFSERNDFFLQNPEQARGGVRESIDDDTIRIDSVQHAIAPWCGLSQLPPRR